MTAVEVVVKLTQKELVGRAKKGDKSAFASLYGMYKDKLYRYAYYKLGDTEDANDAVCDTILMAYEQLNSLRKASAFNSWIFKIHSATCAKYIKEQMQKRELCDIDDFKNYANSKSMLATQNIELNEIMCILNEQEKDVVLLSIVAGFTSKEISKITGLTDGSVRSKLSRSLAKMRAFLE